jgi:cobalt/nickel transport protein
MNKRLLFLMLCTILLAVFISPFASSLPDGLERTALDLGVIDKEAEPIFTFMPDYQVKFIQNEGISTAISGLCGITIILSAFYIFSKYSRAKKW